MNITTVRLYLNNNKIEKIHPKAFWTSESNNITTHTKLKWLQLSNNTIKYIKSGTFDPLINLQDLLLNNNKLSNIDNKFIINLNKLTIFEISNNELTQLPTKWISSENIILNIFSNPIEYLSIKTFEGVNILILRLSLKNMTIEYNTFSKINYIRIMIYHPPKYIWYLNVYGIIYPKCDNSNNNYTSISKYLKE